MICLTVEFLPLESEGLEDCGYEEFVPKKKDFSFKDNLNVNLSKPSQEKTTTAHDYDNVSNTSIGRHIYRGV